jgi:ABC-type branched-subunit amino acid transport system ATPase component
MGEPEIIFEARGVTKRYGAVAALDGVSLATARGTCTAAVINVGTATLALCVDALLGIAERATAPQGVSA